MRPNLSPTRYHLEMLATEIQGHLPVVLEWTDGRMETASWGNTWGEIIAHLLWRDPSDRPLVYGRHPILLIHDATRQPRKGWPQAVIVTLGEEVER